jgi:hypothetical protein
MPNKFLTEPPKCKGLNHAANVVKDEDGLEKWYVHPETGETKPTLCAGCYKAYRAALRAAKAAPTNNPFPTDVTDLVARIKKDETNRKRREAKAAKKAQAETKNDTVADDDSADGDSSTDLNIGTELMEQFLAAAELEAAPA